MAMLTVRGLPYERLRIITLGKGGQNLTLPLDAQVTRLSQAI